MARPDSNRGHHDFQLCGAASERSDGGGFELVAGFLRIAAARSVGLAEVPVVVRDAESEDADRAVENITPKQLNPYEEAKAVHAMLDRGLSEDGAAQALPTSA